ncbi:hypothetical protein Y1Q_0009885 [Alligator mississippiensis]|uniref:Uncharacterized protein n=1 Tax=Alligator mississippiensis TaxID=8496 RepID=A0A151MX49_ALLMI|nr:hypothetical protein Y1Q_0009885 [Alligator mississippiensis]
MGWIRKRNSRRLSGLNCFPGHKHNSLLWISFLKRGSCSQFFAWSNEIWAPASNIATNLDPAGGFFSTMKVSIF